MQIKLISYLLYLLPFSLVTGPFIPDLIISILSIYCLYNYQDKNIKKFFKNKFVKLLLIFWVYLLLRSFFSNSPLFSLESTLFYGRFIFFPISIAYIFQKNLNAFKYFGISLCTCIFIVCVDAYFQFIFNVNTLGFINEETERLSGFFRDELILGSYLSRLLPVTLIFVFYFLPDTINANIIIALIINFILCVIIISGERAAILYSFIIIFLTLILLPKYNIMKILMISFSCIAIIILFVLNPNIKNRIINVTINQFMDKTIKDDSSQSTLDRITLIPNIYNNHYKTALSMFNDNPVFGKGPKMFRKLCSDKKFDYNGCSTHPHHTYLHVMSELGIVGVLPIITLFFLITYKLFKFFIIKYLKKIQMIEEKNYLFIYIAVFITLWPLVPSASFFNNWINVIYFLPLGFYLYFKEIKG